MKNIVQFAIKNELNYFDTSPYYGIKTSEINLGNALVGINRNDFYNINQSWAIWI